MGGYSKYGEMYRNLIRATSSRGFEQAPDSRCRCQTGSRSMASVLNRSTKFKSRGARSCQPADPHMCVPPLTGDGNSRAPGEMNGVAALHVPGMWCEHKRQEEARKGGSAGRLDKDAHHSCAGR